jgi:hypothetical protein
MQLIMVQFFIDGNANQGPLMVYSLSRGEIGGTEVKTDKLCGKCKW